jgi:hypothetical protein
MPIDGTGWEIHLIRDSVQTRAGDGKRRTVGGYQIFHDGVAQTGPDMSGAFAETRGPGDNSAVGNNRRIEQGRYTLRTQGGTKYKTFAYSESASSGTSPKPGIELKGCEPRSEILIHPGRGFLSSIGCINLCTSLPDAAEGITYVSSRRRVIAMLDDMAAFLGSGFPNQNERPVPNAHVVIDGEP